MPQPLPEPRVFAQQQALPPLAALAAQSDLKALSVALHKALLLGYDDEVQAALACPLSPDAHRRLRAALVAALDPKDDTAVTTRLFALPVLMVTGGAAQACVPAVLPAVERVHALFERAGALGQARNVGFANLLCDANGLATIPWSRLLRIGAGSEDSAAALDLPPADIVTTSADEQVHLRFLVGAAITPGQAPWFLETAADIGAWGLALTRELADQLRTDGVSLLPIPRPPAHLVYAIPEGMRAREELAFQAFISRVLRAFRAQVGDPQALIASLRPDAIGIRLSSPFDPGRVEMFRWQLTALDRVEQVQASILELLRECRVADVRLVGEVVTLEQFAVRSRLQ